MSLVGVVVWGARGGERGERGRCEGGGGGRCKGVGGRRGEMQGGRGGDARGERGRCKGGEGEMQGGRGGDARGGGGEGDVRGEGEGDARGGGGMRGGKREKGGDKEGEGGGGGGVVHSFEFLYNLRMASIADRNIIGKLCKVILQLMAYISIIAFLADFTRNFPPLFNPPLEWMSQ